MPCHPYGFEVPKPYGNPNDPSHCLGTGTVVLVIHLNVTADSREDYRIFKVNEPYRKRFGFTPPERPSVASFITWWLEKLSESSSYLSSHSTMDLSTGEHVLKPREPLKYVLPLYDGDDPRNLV